MAAQVNIEGRPARPSFLQVPLHTSSDRGVWGCGCSSPALVATFLVALSSILSIVKELTFLYICSSRSRGPAAAAGGRTPLASNGTPGPEGTHDVPDNSGSAAGGFIQAPGGAGGPQTRTRRISRGLPILASATRQVGWLETCYNRGSAPCLRVFARARARARATASAAATLCGCWVSAWTVLPLFIGALRETGA